jgi:YesN/AraC family two-component response regulator
MALWKKHRREIDLLLTDIVMPGGTMGLELAKKCRAEKPGVKIIISSGYSNEMAQRGKPADGITYLPKPYKTSLLGQVVRDCLDKK